MPRFAGRRLIKERTQAKQLGVREAGLTEGVELPCTVSPLHTSESHSESVFISLTELA